MPFLKSLVQPSCLTADTPPLYSRGLSNLDLNEAGHGLKMSDYRFGCGISFCAVLLKKTTVKDTVERETHLCANGHLVLASNHVEG